MIRSPHDADGEAQMHFTLGKGRGKSGWLLAHLSSVRQHGEVKVRVSGEGRDRTDQTRKLVLRKQTRKGRLAGSGQSNGQQNSYVFDSECWSNRMWDGKPDRWANPSAVSSGEFMYLKTMLTWNHLYSTDKIRIDWRH